MQVFVWQGTYCSKETVIFNIETVSTYGIFFISDFFRLTLVETYFFFNKFGLKKFKERPEYETSHRNQIK